MPRIGACALLALACSLLVGQSAHSQSSSDYSPPRMQASSHDVTVEATRGSSCTFVQAPDGSGNGGCGDNVYPLPLQGAVPAHPGGTVVLESEVAPSEISVSLRDAGSRYLARLPARPVGDSGRRFEVTLPEGPVANRMGVFIRYSTPTESGGTKRGDADYEVGLSEHRHEPASDPDPTDDGEQAREPRRRGTAHLQRSNAFRHGRLTVRTRSAGGRLRASADLRVTTRSGRRRVVALVVRPCRRTRTRLVCRDRASAAVFRPVGPDARHRYVARRTWAGSPDCARVSVRWTTDTRRAHRFPGPAWTRGAVPLDNDRRSLTVC